MTCISISLDISDSVAIKKNIVEIAQSRGQAERLFKEFSLGVAQVEKSFLRTFCRKFNDLKYKKDEIILDEIFVMKNLGDEIWIVINIADSHVNPYHYNNLLYSAIYSCDTIREGYITIIKDAFINIGEYEDELVNDLTVNPMYTKSFIDIITSYVDYTKDRSDILLGGLKDILYIDFGIDKSNEIEQMSKYVENLNIGAVVDKKGDIIRYKTRSDFIGYDVDLFFRCAKAGGLSDVVAVSERAINRLRIPEGEKIIKLRSKKDLLIHTGWPGSTSYRRDWKVSKRVLWGNNMKGIDEKPRIYYLYDDSTLNQLRHNHGMEEGPFDTIQHFKKYF